MENYAMENDDLENSELKTVFQQIKNGDDSARSVLFEAVHRELRQMAEQRMANERASHTLQPTALVNEVFLKVGKDTFENRAHFFFAAARAMKQILIDHARKKKALIRGGDREKVPFDDQIPFGEKSIDVIALDDALTRFRQEYPKHADVVDLHFYTGLSVVDTSEVLDCSPSTVDKRWKFAKAWLRADIAMGDSVLLERPGKE